MITQDELDNIYDKGQGPSDPATQGPKPRILGGSNSTPTGTAAPRIMQPSGNNAMRDSNVPTEDYTGYIKNGIFEDQGDLNLRRGENQSAWDKWGNMLARVVPKMALGLVENVGYLGALLGESGDNRDYSNPLTRSMIEAKNWIDSKLPIYRKNNDTFGLTDAGWWAENIGNLAESAGSFAVEGIGFAKLFGKLGEATSLITKNRVALNAAHKAEELLTSGALAYTEGAQMGKSVYDKTYDAQLTKGMAAGLSYEDADKQASHVAAQSAATTVQLNTMLNTGLNLEMLSGAFSHKTEDAIRKFWTKNSAQLEGETFDQFANRIRTGTNISDVKKEIFPHSGLKHYAIGAMSEGIEELTNNFAQTTGEQLGQQWDPKTKSGKTKGLIGQLGELSHYFDRTMDANGALSFVLGAVGGVAQSGLIDNIPLHKDLALDKVTGKPLVDDKGNPTNQQEFVSARIKGKYQDTRYFNNVRDAIVEDVGHIEDLKAKMKIARETGHHDQADAYGDQLFNAMNYNAVHMGMGANYAKTFEEIGSVDNETIGQDGKTDAMRQGYATSTKDNAYKVKAADAVQTMKALEDIHAKVQAKYGGSSNPAIERVADIISNRKMSLYTQKQRIDRLEGEVNNLTLQHKAALDAAGTSLDVDGINSEIIQHNNNIQVATETQARLVAQDKMIARALQTLAVNPNDKGANAVVDNLIRKYQLTEEKNPATAIKQLRERLLKKHEEVGQNIKDSQDKLFNSIGYTKWLEKNPKKTFNDFTEEVSKKHSLDQQVLLTRAFLEDQKLEHAEGTAQLLGVESTNGLVKLQRQSETLYKDLIRKSTEQQNKDLMERAKRARQVVATAENLLKSKNNLLTKYQGALVKLHKQLGDLSMALQRTNDDILALTRKDPLTLTKVDENKWSGLSFTKYRQEENLNNIKTAIAKIESLSDNAVQEITQLKEDLDEPEVAPKEVAPNNDTEPVDTVVQPGPDEVVIPEPKLQPVEEVLNEATATPAKAPDPDMTAVAEARDAYVFELMLAPVVVRTSVESYEASLNGKPDVNLDLLHNHVQNGTISVHDAGRIMLALKQYLQTVQDLKTEMNVTAQEITAITQAVENNLVNNQVEEVAQPAEVVNESGIILEPDSAVTLSTDLTAIEDPDTEHTGTKTEDVIKVQTMGLDYVEFKDPITSDYRMHSLTDKLNPDTNPDVLTPGKLMPGTTVLLAIDTDFNGEVNIDDHLATTDEGYRQRQTDSINNYYDDNGQIKTDDHSIFNVPIKIVHDGKTIGWLPRMDWVTASYEGATGSEKYRNVVQFKKVGDAYIDNMAAQIQNMTRVRRMIIAAHNQGRGYLDTVTLTKGAGTPIKNIKVNLNTETTVKETRDDRKVTKLILEKTAKLMPDSDLKLGIVVKSPSGNRLAVGYNGGTKEFVDYSGNLAFDPKTLGKYNNLPVAIMPGANGDAHIAPLLSRKIYNEDGIQSDFNTLVRSIEVFIGASSDDLDAKSAFQDEAAKIEAATRFNITTEQGLSDFINQYITHTKDFDDALVAASVDSEGKSPLEFNIKVEPKLDGQSRGSVKIGTTFSGQEVQSAILLNGKLNPDFVQSLKEGLGNRYKNVVFEKDNLKGLQSRGTFTGAKVRANGVWEFKEHNSYNDYVKENTQTYFVGKNQLVGRYVYAVNPQITLNVQKLMENFQPKVILTAIPDPVANNRDIASYNTSLEQELSELSDMAVTLTPQDPVIENATQQSELPNNTAVTMRSLTEKYNFTPEEHRNGKTPEEVFDDMQRLGIPYLHIDYNPFSKCL